MTIVPSNSGKFVKEMFIFPIYKVVPKRFRTGSPVDVYRKYYQNKLTEWVKREKPIIPRWTNKSKPDWLDIPEYKEV